jgi:hypothetical protein
MIPVALGAVPVTSTRYAPAELAAQASLAVPDAPAVARGILAEELRGEPVPKPQARPVVALTLNVRETVPVKVPVAVAVKVEFAQFPSAVVKVDGLATRV